MEPEGVEALLHGPSGPAVLERAAQVLSATGDPLRAQELLRTQVGPATAAAALAQLELRARAVAKFGRDASRLFFTRDGLEQATRGRVAAWRAARVAESLAQHGYLPAVTDLGCGIGADLLAFAAAGLRAHGVERDAITAAIARANGAALGLSVTVEEADVTEALIRRLDPAAALFADPARRNATGRAWTPSAWSPPWALVRSLLTAARPIVVKAAPGLPHQEIPDGVGADWVSDGGDVVECCLWSPALVPGGSRRRAVLLGPDGPHTITGDPALRAPVRGDFGAYLLEPDGAVIRAGLVGTVAAEHAAWAPAEGIAYLMTDRQPLQATPGGRWFRVVAELPKKTGALRGELRRRGLGRLTIKKRGVQQDIEQLRKQLLRPVEREQNTGGAGTIVLTPRRTGRGNRLAVLLVEPLH